MGATSWLEAPARISLDVGSAFQAWPWQSYGTAGGLYPTRPCRVWTIASTIEGLIRSWLMPRIPQSTTKLKMSGWFTCAALTLTPTASSASSTKWSCEVVVRLATVERDVAAMRVRLDSLDGRVARIEGRVDLQREIAKLVAVLES